MEVRMRVYHLRENRIGVPEELARLGIGVGRGVHGFSSRSVSPSATPVRRTARTYMRGLTPVKASGDLAVALRPAVLLRNIERH